MTLVQQLRGRFGVEPVLRVPGIASSTFHGWVARQAHPSPRERDDRTITAEIADIHAASGGAYGSPRVHQVLRRRGIHVFRKRVERLMRQAGPQGAFLRENGGHRRPGRIREPHRRPTGSTATSALPLRTGCGLPTPPESPPVPAARRSFGCSNATSPARSTAKSSALSHPRQHQPRSNSRHRGINALVENFFSTLKVELVYRSSWHTRDEAENALFAYVDGFHNTGRIQKDLGWLGPDEYEAARHAAQVAPTTIPASPNAAR